MRISYLADPKFYQLMQEPLSSTSCPPASENSHILDKIRSLTRYIDNGRTWKGWFYGTKINQICMLDILYGKAKLSFFKKDIQNLFSLRDHEFYNLNARSQKDLFWIAKRLGWVNTETLRSEFFQMQDQDITIEAYNLAQKKLSSVLTITAIPTITQLVFSLYINPPKLSWNTLIALTKVTPSLLQSALLSISIKPPEITRKGFFAGTKLNHITTQDIAEGNANLSFFEESLQLALNLTDQEKNEIINITDPNVLRDRLQLLAFRPQAHLDPVEQGRQSVDQSYECLLILAKLYKLVIKMQYPDNLSKLLDLSNQSSQAIQHIIHLQTKMPQTAPVAKATFALYLLHCHSRSLLYPFLSHMLGLILLSCLSGLFVYLVSAQKHEEKRNLNV
jgi:hypothetical protein